MDDEGQVRPLVSVSDIMWVMDDQTSIKLI